MKKTRLNRREQQALGKRFTLLLTSLLALILLAFPAFASEDDACISCHGNYDAIHAAYGHNAVSQVGSVVLFADDAHDEAGWYGPKPYFSVGVNCTTCHTTDLIAVHANDCAKCHPTAYDQLGGPWQGTCQQGGCHVAYHEDSIPAHLPFEDHSQFRRKRLPYMSQFSHLGRAPDQLSELSCQLRIRLHPAGNDNRCSDHLRRGSCNKVLDHRQRQGRDRHHFLSARQRIGDLRYASCAQQPWATYTRVLVCRPGRQRRVAEQNGNLRNLLGCHAAVNDCDCPIHLLPGRRDQAHRVGQQRNRRESLLLQNQRRPGPDRQQRRHPRDAWHDCIHAGLLVCRLGI